MAEEKRGQPRESDRPQSGSARTGQGPVRPQGVPARTGQGSVRPQGIPARTGQGSVRPQGVPARTGQSSVRPQGIPARTGQSSVRPQGVPARTGQSSVRSQSSAARTGQSAGRSRSSVGQTGQSAGRPQSGAARSRQGSSRSRQGAGRTRREPEQRSRARKPVRRERSTKARVAGALLYVLIVIASAAFMATLGWMWACDLLGLNKEYVSAEITITDDTRMDSVVDILEEKGLIEYKLLFKLYARFSHAEDKIAAGTYVLDTEMDYHALVSNMSSSSATRQTTNVTIPEGYTTDQIFALLEERGVSTVEKLRDMAANWDYAFDWLQDIPLGDYHRLEGYLFPDTYTFQMGENPKYVINKMLVNFDIKMDEYMEELNAADAPYSLHDIVIIASLIEKETDGTVDDEHGRNDYKSIASVIYNRLEKPGAETAGYLQIDATLVYINGGKVPTVADRSINSPYNTYLYQGLPVGPISNPGMTSLLAAMDPASTGYFFYALNPATGQHEYSRTYAEHQAMLSRFNSNG